MDERDPRTAILEGFRAGFAACSPFRDDLAHLDDLVKEATPVVDTLLAADELGQTAGPGYGEGLAMLTLLGRRAGVIGLTPTAALGVVDALARGFREGGRPMDEQRLATLRTLCMEGYVAGREEQAKDAQQLGWSEGAPTVTFAPRCLGLFLVGDMEPASISATADRFGRELLRQDAAACVVDLRKLEFPTAERAAEAFGVDATARMLGAECHFVGVGHEWIEAADEGRVSMAMLRLHDTFESALRAALGRAELALVPRKRSRWPFSKNA